MWCCVVECSNVYWYATLFFISLLCIKVPLPIEYFVIWNEIIITYNDWYIFLQQQAENDHNNNIFFCSTNDINFRRFCSGWNRSWSIVAIDYHRYCCTYIHFLVQEEKTIQGKTSCRDTTTKGSTGMSDLFTRMYVACLLLILKNKIVSDNCLIFKRGWLSYLCRKVQWHLKLGNLKALLAIRKLIGFDPFVYCLWSILLLLLIFSNFLYFYKYHHLKWKLSKHRVWVN